MPGFSQMAFFTLLREISSRMTVNVIGWSLPSRETTMVTCVPRGPFSRSATSVVVRLSAVSLFALCLFTGQSTGVWLAGKVVDAYGTEPVFVAASLGLALLGWGFRRWLKIHAPSARA